MRPPGRGRDPDYEWMMRLGRVGTHARTLAALTTVGEGGVSHVHQADRGLPIVYESRGVAGA